MIGIRYTDSFYVKSLNNSKDSGGAIEPTTTTGAEQKGFLSPYAGSETTYNEKMESTVTHILFCDLAVAVSEDDLISINGEDMEVVYIHNFDKQTNQHKEIFLNAKN